jgi:hypothetical protein
MIDALALCGAQYQSGLYYERQAKGVRVCFFSPEVKK